MFATSFFKSFIILNNFSEVSSNSFNPFGNKSKFFPVRIVKRTELDSFSI